MQVWVREKSGAVPLLPHTLQVIISCSKFVVRVAAGPILRCGGETKFQPLVSMRTPEKILTGWIAGRTLSEIWITS